MNSQWTVNAEMPVLADVWKRRRGELRGTPQLLPAVVVGQRWGSGEGWVQRG